MAGDDSYTRVFVPGAFTPRVMRLLASSLKRNLNTFFLLDVSESMRPFADYVVSFNQSVAAMRKEGIGLRMNRIFSYWDSSESWQDSTAAPHFVRVRRPEEIRFVQRSRDRNYAEPLMRALQRVLDEIASLQEQQLILPLQEKLLFIITDAGANDADPGRLADILQRCKSLNLKTYFVYPSDHGVRHPSGSLTDTPGDAYRGLEELVSEFTRNSAENGESAFRPFTFEAAALKSEERRREDFATQHRNLLEGIRHYIDHVFDTAAPGGEIPKDVVLYFSDARLLQEMRKWSDRKIQVLNHVVKYVKNVHQTDVWEERIAIPAKPVESFLRAIRTQDDVSLSDLKKLVIINSLVSVDDIQRCRSLYDYIKPLIEKRMFKSADDIFYQALTNKIPDDNLRWNSSLGDDKGPLGEYLSGRGFHLNAFNQAVQRKFMYLKVGELYAPAD